MLNVCFNCGRTFKSVEALECHQTIHVETRCDRCDEIFRSPQACVNHKFDVHNVLVFFECRFCSLAYSDFEERTNHEIDNHY